jgi:hypothetical protein
VLFVAVPLRQARSDNVVVTHEWMLFDKDDLKYVYNAGHNMIFTIYIKTNSIITVNTLNYEIHQCRLVNVYSQNGKVIANVGEGTMVIDNDTIKYGKAVYVRQQNNNYGVTQLY